MQRVGHLCVHFALLFAAVLCLNNLILLRRGISMDVQMAMKVAIVAPELEKKQKIRKVELDPQKEVKHQQDPAKGGKGQQDPAKGDVLCGGHRAPSCEQCPMGHGSLWCHGECQWDDSNSVCIARPSFTHPDYSTLLKEYPFQPVRNDKGNFVNIILVRSPMSEHQQQLYHKYKNDILFLGISSFEAYPMNSPNPYSANFTEDIYRGIFPGFLTMMKEPEKFFEPHVKTILLSESDFGLDNALLFGRQARPKLYDFTYSGTDQNIGNDCKGWHSYAKNWSFAREALEVFCSPEFNLTGVLTSTTKGNSSCSIPESCKGKMLQTKFLSQSEFFTYLTQSRFAFLPQIYDASPRVSSQALSLNVPLLMNRNILGGWKYLNEKTGEFFHDMSDFKQSLRKLLANLDSYEPRNFIEGNYGNEISGRRFLNFVKENWPDRNVFPEDSRLLLPAGA